jgi:hypothetical protein
MHRIMTERMMIDFDSDQANGCQDIEQIYFTRSRICISFRIVTLPNNNPRVTDAAVSVEISRVAFS